MGSFTCAAPAETRSAVVRCSSAIWFIFLSPSVRQHGLLTTHRKDRGNRLDPSATLPYRPAGHCVSALSRGPRDSFGPRAGNLRIDRPRDLRIPTWDTLAQ